MWSYVYISKDDQENDGTKCDEDISVEQESSTLNRAPKRDMNFDSSTHRKDYQNGQWTNLYENPDRNIAWH
jgi:hypothetical protein